VRDLDGNVNSWSSLYSSLGSVMSKCNRKFDHTPKKKKKMIRMLDLDYWIKTRKVILFVSRLGHYQVGG